MKRYFFAWIGIVTVSMGAEQSGTWLCPVFAVLGSLIIYLLVEEGEK